MTCNATGGDDLTVQWLRFGQVIGDTGRVRQSDGVLRIDKLENGDAGGYACVARDGAGEDRDSIDLMFGGKASPRVESRLILPFSCSRTARSAFGAVSLTATITSIRYDLRCRTNRFYCGGSDSYRYRSSFR